jgi:hypothetical protein
MGTRLYRAALYLYPPRFRREFGAEMAADFEDAQRELASPGPEGPGLHRKGPGLLLSFGADLIGSLVVQWLRTGLPVIIVMAVAWPIVLLSAVARYWRPVFFQLPPRSEDADVIALVMLVTVVLFIVVATVMFTLCFAIRPIRRRRRR